MKIGHEYRTIRLPTRSHLLRLGQLRCFARFGLMLIILLILVSCTGSKHTSSNPPSPRASASQSATRAAHAAPVRDCSQGSSRDLMLNNNDVAAGPLVFGNMKLAGTAAGLREFYGNGQVPQGPDGSKYYKMGVQLKAGSTVLLSVAPKAMSYLRLQQGQSPATPEVAFTFQACPGTGYTGWVGGFDIKGGVPACIALDVHVTGEPDQRVLNIPFGGAACA